MLNALRMFVPCMTVAPMGYFGLSPGYVGRGNGAPTLSAYTAGCSTIPAQLMCGGLSRIETVAAFRVACVSSLYNDVYVGSPMILSKVWNVNDALMSSAEGVFNVILR